MSLQEARLLKQLRGIRSIVSYIDDFMTPKEKHVLLTEYCDGGDLVSFIENEGGKKENILAYMKYFADMIEGVNELHKRNIVHRDIKPHNFSLFKVDQSLERYVKLGGLSIAREASEEDGNMTG